MPIDGRRTVRGCSDHDRSRALAPAGFAGEHVVTALAEGLGLVHRDVGVAEQVVDARSSTASRSRCRCSPRPRPACPAIVSGAWKASSRRSATRVRVPDVVDVHAAGSRTRRRRDGRPRSVGAEAVPDPRGDRDQEFVAGDVAEAVVHGLEVVEIEEQGGDRARPGARRERGLGLLDEAPSVGQPGQRVVEGLVAELGLERACAWPRRGRAARRGRTSRASTRSESRAVPRGDDRQAAVGPGTERHEDRPGHHRGRQADEPDGPEPRDRHRVRVGQSAHRRMRRRDAEQDVGDEVDAVERPAARRTCRRGSGARRSGRRRAAPARLTASIRKDEVRAPGVVSRPIATPISSRSAIG